MPSMASDSCHITSGCSGFPKFRQFTSPTGRAPTHARFMTASATTSAVPRRGSTAHHRWLPSQVMARPRPVSTPLTGCFRRSTAASPPGASTVLRKSWWSYWRNTQLGSASSDSRSPSTSPGSGAGPGAVAGRRLPDRSVVERCVGIERRGGDVGEHLAIEPIQDAEPTRAGDGADHRRRDLPLAGRWRGGRRAWPARRSRASAPGSRWS